MKNRFIPVNNNIDKTVAFAQSLDKSFREANQIKQTPYYIETVDIIRDLQKYGWRINGVCEQRGRNRKITNNYVKMEHPDFTIMNKNKTEGLANLYVSNSCNGKSPLNLDLGMYRLVCSNGLIRKTSFIEHNIKHNEKSIKRIPLILSNINQAAQKVLEGFDRLKHIELEPAKLNELVAKAARLRFEDNEIDNNQLLTSYRKEDEGNSLWSVYNRIQENLTKPNVLIDRSGRPISGTYNVQNDISVNQKLFELVESYA